MKQADLDEVLFQASKLGWLPVVKQVLVDGADVHARDNKALRYAADKGYTEIVRLLLEAGADVHAEGNYALRWAAYNGHIEAVKLLLEAGAAACPTCRKGACKQDKLAGHTCPDVRAWNNQALRWAANNEHTETEKVIRDWMDKHEAS